MKIQIVTSGKPKQDYILAGISAYAEKISRYIEFSVLHVPSPRHINDPDLIKIAEGKALMKNITVRDHVILLDEHGKLFSSAGLAGWLGKHQQRGTKSLVFLIGGPFGFSDDVHKRANEIISLSPLTLQHDLAAFVFIEQLYRVFTIMRREKYHH